MSFVSRFRLAHQFALIAALALAMLAVPTAATLGATIVFLAARYVFADSVGTRLLRNRMGDSAGVFGAARLWPV